MTQPSLLPEIGERRKAENGSTALMRSIERAIFDPTFESSPSPISAEITAPADASSSITVTVPEIDWQLFFNVAGSARATRSGYRVRIYRRRKSVLGAAPFKTITKVAHGH